MDDPDPGWRVRRDPQHALHALHASLAVAGHQRGQLLDDLLGALLGAFAGLDGRPTDGVLVEHEQQSGQDYRALGLAVMIADQRVEPVGFSLHLAPGGELHQAEVCFGLPATEAAAAHGSRAHRRLAAALLAGSARPWRHRFVWGPAGWRVA